MSLFMICVAALAASFGCSGSGTNSPATGPQTANVNNTAPASSPGQQTAGALEPAKNLTAADVEKIKWLEGVYKGTFNDKPFYNRYRLEGTTLKVNRFEDEAMTKQTEFATYELKDGMFANPTGEPRFAAVKMTEDTVQFVTLSGTTASYKLEKKADGGIHATLESAGLGGKPSKNSFELERLKK
jgi:hypothetical protein